MKNIFALCAVLLVFVSPAFAQEPAFEPVATIIEIEGEAFVSNKLAENTPLEINAPVFETDIIGTGVDSKLHLLFLDDTELTIGENAEFSVKNFTYQPENNRENKATLSFLRGAFLFVSGQVAKINKPDVTIETPVATIGIRGTIVWGGRLDDQYNVFVKEGEVSVSNGRGNALVREGQGTTLTDEYTRPGRAQEWSEEKVNRAVATIALADQDAVAERVAENRGLLLEQIQNLKDLTPPENIDTPDEQSAPPTTPTDDGEDGAEEPKQ